jgi:hypothetical protein
MNRDGIFGCTKPIVDSLYEVLHNGHDGEVANAPPRKQPGLKADFRKFGSERFLAGPNRIQLTQSDLVPATCIQSEGACLRRR